MNHFRYLRILIQAIFMMVNRNGEVITSPLPANWCLQNNAHKMGWGDTCTAASNQTHYLRSKNSIRTTNVHFYVIIRNQILLIYLELVDFFSLFFLGISFKLYMSGGIHRLSPVLEQDSCSICCGECIVWCAYILLARAYQVFSAVLKWLVPLICGPECNWDHLSAIAMSWWTPHWEGSIHSNTLYCVRQLRWWAVSKHNWEVIKFEHSNMFP